MSRLVLSRFRFDNYQFFTSLIKTSSLFIIDEIISSLIYIYLTLQLRYSQNVIYRKKIFVVVIIVDYSFWKLSVKMSNVNFKMKLTALGTDLNFKEIVSNQKALLHYITVKYG